ncbi:MAG: zf-HC2 domain-containing protein [Anaerolineae bacterium]|nr:zf-HC2 domain-containing protein [Anaerolineae bacterium]
MKCELERLMAYRDRALGPDEAQAVETHLHQCAACRQQLALLETRGEAVAQHLKVLDPGPLAQPHAAGAWARFQERARSQAPTGPARSRWANLKRRWIMHGTRLTTSRRWRPVALALATLVVLAVLFSFAPVRQAGADFLGIFRVRKFAIISLSPEQMERLQELGTLLESALQPQQVREPGEPQPVSSAAEASALAGFHVRVPTALPEGATRQEFFVQEGPALRLEVPRQAAQTLLEALGMADVALPPLDPLVAEADVPVVVHQVYQVVGSLGRLEVTQIRSPSATLPEGVDPAFLGQLLLQALGIPEEEAQRLAETLDWTSTLVVPVPQNLAQAREVEVDGVLGLWIQERQSQQDTDPPATMVLWQKDDVVYAMLGTGISNSALLRAADSLR